MKKGKHTTIILAGEQHEAQYALCELDFLQASHNEETFAPNPKFPTTSRGETINDRDYSNDEVAQGLIQQYALNLEPALLINDHPSSEGTPIITEAGVVVSGNNRTMSLKLAAKIYPEKYEAYKKLLRSKWPDFRADANDTLSEFKQPVLVRIDYDFGDYNTENMGKYNKSYMKGKAPLDRAIELSKTLELPSKSACSSSLPQIVGQFDTLAQLFADPKYSKLLFEKLLDCNILTPAEQKTYFSAGAFSVSGRELVELTLLAMVMQPNTLRLCNHSGVKFVTNKVISALALIMENKGVGAKFSLLLTINEAVAIAYQISISEAPSEAKFQSLLNSFSMFDGAKPAYSYNGLVMNRVLSSMPVRDFKAYLSKYNNTAASQGGDSLFVQSAAEPSEAFDFYFASRIDPKELKIIKDYHKANNARALYEILNTIYQKGKVIKQRLTQYRQNLPKI